MISFSTYSQDIATTCGEYFSNMNGSVSFTIGEPVIETFSGSNKIITQGFQQSKFYPVSVEEPIQSQLSILMSPNPVNDILKIQILDSRDANYYIKLFSGNGGLLLDGEIQGPDSEISFDHFAPGVYMLYVSNNQGEFSLHKIIKY